MILIGEQLNIMSQTLGPALKERDPKPIQEMARAEDEAGVDYIDLNIGPARKGGEELMEWVVKTVQEVTDKPLSLDTTNLTAMEAGLKVRKGKALMNSISHQPARLEQGLDRFNEWGLDRNMVAERTLITPACGVGSLEPSLAERIFELLSCLSAAMYP